MTSEGDAQKRAQSTGMSADGGASSSAATGANPATVILTSPSLDSLASRYIPGQHATYLRHLTEAVTKPRNLNIALTGRYGTGKSSVLDEFESKNKGKSLRMAISSLGTSPEVTTLTNRIQKEIVKQLLYREAPRDLRFSRFKRIVPLSTMRAALQAGVTVVAVGSMLAFLKWLPALAGTGPSHSVPVRVLSWLAFALLVVGVLTVVQRFLYGRFFVSNLSAGGAAVTLAQSSSTYFDEYLDEIVYFFDEISPNIVIFEDLDRFDDPHIFEALRELNTLLNQTAKRRKKGEPLRFIYAIKDSLFERLGVDKTESKHDAAAAETERANRTKFFDVVIPLVPFISHRNARELLTGLLDAHGFTGIDRPVVALVAQHATDMRLLTNICNEYAVFAERLITSGESAPGLTPNNLFALVAYKNFHLEDFEEISRNNSDLDTLYEQRRELVRANIDALEERKRGLLNEPTRVQSMKSTVDQLGDRLITVATAIRTASGHTTRHLLFQFSGQSNVHALDQVKTYQFWAAMEAAGEVYVWVSPHPQNAGGGHRVYTFDRNHIHELFPEMSGVDGWAEIDESENQETIAQINADIAFLRGADFSDLARVSQFAVPTDGVPMPFAAVIDATMKSRLARNLVKQGYLDRNFALYAAQFYGDFTGVDVANFIVQSVQPNRMDIDYPFSGPGAIGNLLAEVPEDFSHTVSAYNVEILDYLLRRNDYRATDIARTIASGFGDEAQEFLRAYLNQGSQRAELAAALSNLPWRSVFTYLVENAGVPDNDRPALVDAALRESNGYAAYDLGSEVHSFVLAHYLDMDVFTGRQDDDVIDKIVALIKELGISLPMLGGLDQATLDRMVRENLYVLTADNLREALDITGDVSLDRVHENAHVYDRCLGDPDAYLTAVENDADTSFSVLTAATLAKTLADVAEVWETDDVRRAISMAAPESRLEALEVVPRSCWSALAEHRLFRSTVRNTQDYRDAIGTIDSNLASLLVEAGSIDAEGEDNDARAKVAVDVLNADETIPGASERVNLVLTLGVEQYLPPSAIKPEAGELLALLLEHDIVEDSYESFAHFSKAGWRAIEPAIGTSEEFAGFMTPELVSGFGADFLGSYADARKRPLPVDQVRRVAAATRDKELTLRLLTAISPMPPANELAVALAELGRPYDYLTDGGRSEFEVPGDADHRAVFEYLKDSGRITGFKKQRNKNMYTVSLV